MPTRPPMYRPPGHVPAPNKPAAVQDPFYGTAKWKRIRAIVLERDGYQCTQPDCPTSNRGKGGRLIAGHIIARPARGADHPANVRSFCPRATIVSTPRKERWDARWRRLP
jgi:hypothetical protein